VLEELPPATVVVEDPALRESARAERIATLRQKIAASGLVTLPVSSESIPSDDGASDSATSTEPDRVVAALSCSEPVSYQGVWDTRGINFQESEGARVVYREDTSRATSTFATEVLLQLPTRAYPIGAAVCPSTDVIGVALDGSLMRQNEVALYSIFGAESLLGYALDGFPVYGSFGAPPLDECGGAVVSGQYRYFLDADRPTLITCFSDTPVSLP
jgi:hypothetical protein